MSSHVNCNKEQSGNRDLPAVQTSNTLCVKQVETSKEASVKGSGDQGNGEVQMQINAGSKAVAIVINRNMDPTNSKDDQLGGEMDGFMKVLSDKINKWGRELKKDIRDGNAKHAEDIAVIKTENNQIKKDLLEVKSEVGKYKAQVQNLIGVVCKQQLVINECKGQLENIQMSSMCNNIIIRGIKESENENCVQLCADFFRHKMKIESPVGIANAYRISGGKDRPMLVILQNNKDKGRIFKHGKNLKDVTNYEGDAYRVDNQLPGAKQEKEIHHRYLMSKNRKLQGTSDQLQMSLKKGVLTVDDAVYKKGIATPSVKERTEPSETCAFPVTRGNVVSLQTSTFIGYSTAV